MRRKRALSKPSRVMLLLVLSGFISIHLGAAAAAEHPADDFKLTDQNGQSFRLSQVRGKVALLFFGYTHCPDACPTTMAKLARVYKMLGSGSSQVVTLFVSVDPQRDTPDSLKLHLAYFHMNSIGLTGSKEEIDAVVKQYGGRYQIEQSDSAAGYHVSHSTDLYLLDQKGELAKTFKYGDGPQIVAGGVCQLVYSSAALERTRRRCTSGGRPSI
jgi:cytochrome oxidase Cu insertion factor (SCO1/SenC/PrrC family)